jgi:hypothetical protein
MIMFMSRYGSLVGLVALSGAFACSSSTDKKSSADAGSSETGGKGGSGGSGAGGGTAGKGGSAAPDSGSAGFDLGWSLLDMQPGSDAGVPDAGAPPAPPLAGVKVCVNGHEEIACVTSDADGRFTLKALPPRTVLVLTFEKTGYLKQSKTIETASTDMQGTNSIPIYAEATAIGPSGVTQAKGKGTMDFFAIGPLPGNPDPNAFQGIPDVAVTLSPAKGDGPYFINAKNKFVDGATKTIAGVGFYFNLDPGDYTITFDQPAFDCAPISIGFSGWGVPVPPNGVKFTVLADYMTTEAGVFCTPKSVIVGGDGG